LIQSFSLYDALGLVGAGMFVVAFAGVQIERMGAHGWPALTLNFVGAILILISLRHAFNLASFVLETVWGLIALFGLIKLVVRRKR
jgi:hypothetical protein